MGQKLATCQCERGDNQCPRTVTQEDFLCDVCRRGCAVLTIMWDEPERQGHYEMRPWPSKPAGPTLAVEYAFATAPDVATPTWTDIGDLGAG